MSGVYNKLANKVTEGFQSGSGSDAAGAIAAFLAIVLIIVIHLFIVQWLWNKVLVPAVSVVRPLKSVYQTLGLLILVALIHPGSVGMA